MKHFWNNCHGTCFFIGELAWKGKMLSEKKRVKQFFNYFQLMTVSKPADQSLSSVTCLLLSRNL